MISFRSKITQKILNYYFLNPRARHYINELARILNLDPKNVDRKLKELERTGLLHSDFFGKERYFSLAKNSPKVQTYKKFFLQTFGLEGELRQILVRVPGIKEAYLYGSYAKNSMDEGSDIDVLAIGSHSVFALQKKINQVQKSIGREINLVNMSTEEYRQKKSQRNAFLKNIFSGQIIKLL